MWRGPAENIVAGNAGAEWTVEGGTPVGTRLSEEYIASISRIEISKKLAY
jgi:hypothetical protein